MRVCKKGRGGEGKSMLWGWMQEGSGYISFLCVKSTKSPLTQMDAFRPLS